MNIYSFILLVISFVSSSIDVARATQLEEESAFAAPYKRGLRQRRVKSKSKEEGAFAEESLVGDYAYHNHISDVGSWGVMHFDGEGGVTMDNLRVNTPDGSGSRATTSLGQGMGTYVIGDSGTGFLSIEFTDFDRPLEYEFIVVKSDKAKKGQVKPALEVSSFLTTGGLDGQLVTPTWSRI